MGTEPVGRRCDATSAPVAARGRDRGLTVALKPGALHLVRLPPNWPARPHPVSAPFGGGVGLLCRLATFRDRARVREPVPPAASPAASFGLGWELRPIGLIRLRTFGLWSGAPRRRPDRAGRRARHCGIGHAKSAKSGAASRAQPARPGGLNPPGDKRSLKLPETGRLEAGLRRARGNVVWPHLAA